MLSSVPVECPGYLLEKARALAPASTAVVGAGSQVVLESCRLATEAGLITPILIGDPATVKAVAEDIGWDISGLRLVPSNDQQQAAQTATALARGGEVSSLMKGDIRTDELLKAVIDKQSGLAGKNRLSHVFHMTLPGSDQPLCITDAVINVLPTVAIKLDIARNATSLMHALGKQEAKIALLSATEVATASMPSSVEAEEIARAAAQGAVPGALVDGPFAFDNAVSPKAAQLKGVDGPVAGNADVLLVPNIETGNALFKQMVYFMSAAAAGLVLGAKIPIILTSRADPVQARLAAAALSSIYAAHTG
ncbi:MAG: bifunctional enoyl-CoA hydratase/phosphate acetyltransferase [Pseudomonadota bacterium]